MASNAQVRSKTAKSIEKKPRSYDSSSDPSIEEQPRAIACHFFKRDPVTHKKCGKYSLHSTCDIVQHFQRRHRQPPHCPNCSRVYEDRDALAVHIQGGDCVPTESDIALEGVTEQQMKSIWDSRFNVRRASSQETRWYEIWDILFPNTPRTASPYISKPDDTSALEWFLCCLGLDGHSPVIDFIDGRNNPELNQQDEILSQLRIVGTGILRILQEWSANQVRPGPAPLYDTPPASAPGSAPGSTLLLKRALDTDASANRDFIFHEEDCILLPVLPSWEELVSGRLLNQTPEIGRIAQHETSVPSSSTEQYGTRNLSAVAFSNERSHRDDGIPLPIADDLDASSRSSSSLTMSESDEDEFSPSFPQCLIAIEPVVLREVIHTWRASGAVMRAGSEGTVTSTGINGTTLASSSDVQRGKSKGKQTLKRCRDDDQISEDEDGEPLTRKKRNQGAGSDTVRLACPFQKLEPERHQLCGITSRCAGWKKISHVKQHLWRTHCRPYCPRCKQEFPTTAERDSHSEGQSAVELCEVRSLDTSTRLDDRVADELRRRVSKTLSTADQWFSIWDLIFPGVPRPLTCTIDDVEIPIEAQGLLASLNTSGTQTIVRVLHEHNLTFRSTQNGITEEVQDDFIHHVLQQAISQIVDEWRRRRSQLTKDAAAGQPGAGIRPLSTTADTGSTTSNPPPTLVAGLESASESRASAAPVDQTQPETIEQMDYWVFPDVGGQIHNYMGASTGNWDWDNFTTDFSSGTAALDVEGHQCCVHGHGTGAEKQSSNCTCKPLPDIP